MLQHDVDPIFSEMFPAVEGSLKLDGVSITDDQLNKRLAELEESWVTRFTPWAREEAFIKGLKEKAQGEWEETHPPVDGGKLEKLARTERKKLMLKSWMSERMALGETAEALIEHAAKHDQNVALMLRKCADELGRETA